MHFHIISCSLVFEKLNKFTTPSLKLVWVVNEATWYRLMEQCLVDIKTVMIIGITSANAVVPTADPTGGIKGLG